MSTDDLQTNSGKPKDVVVKKVKNKEYEVWVYDNYDVYIEDGKIVFWEQKNSVLDDGLQVAYDSYKKALELDPKSMDGVKPLIEKVISGFKQEADISFSLEQYGRAAKAFANVYDYSKLPPVDIVDTIYAYNAGFISILAEDYDNAVKYLEEVKDLGFYNNGDVYKLLYFAYQGKKDNENSEKVLREGIQRYPEFTELVEHLIGLYSVTGKDIEGIAPLLRDAIESNPENFVFHFGLGTIYLKNEDYPQAIERFKKSSEIDPSDFGSYYNLSVAIIRSTDSRIDELNLIPVSEQERYEELKEEINEVFRSALPYLLKAHELEPTDASTVQLIRNIYDRFQNDSDEMAENYKKYEELWETLLNK